VGASSSCGSGVPIPMPYDTVQGRPRRSRATENVSLLTALAGDVDKGDDVRHSILVFTLLHFALLYAVVSHTVVHP
jgi:hypothetical protein